MTSYCPVPGVGPETPADHDYEGGFAAALMLKDLKLAADAAQSVGAYTPMGGEAEELYQRFVDRGGGAQGFLRHHQDDRRQLEGTRRSECALRCLRCHWRCWPPAAVPKRARPTTARQTSARAPSPADNYQRQCHGRSLRTGQRATGDAIMHERHEGMETIGKNIKATPPRARRRVARPRGRSAHPPRTLPTWRKKSSGWFPQGTGPDVGKDRRQARNLAGPAGLRRQDRGFPESGAGVQQPRRAGNDIAAIKAQLRATSARPARPATTSTASEMHH